MWRRVQRRALHGFQGPGYPKAHALPPDRPAQGHLVHKSLLPTNLSSEEFPNPASQGRLPHSRRGHEQERAVPRVRQNPPLSNGLLSCELRRLNRCLRWWCLRWWCLRRCLIRCRLNRRCFGLFLLPGPCLGSGVLRSARLLRLLRLRLVFGRLHPFLIIRGFNTRRAGGWAGLGLQAQPTATRGTGWVLENTLFRPQQGARTRPCRTPPTA